MPPRCGMLQRNSRRPPLLHKVYTYTCTQTFTISCFPSSKIGHSSERQALFWECEAKQNKTVELEVLLKARGKKGCRRRIASSNTHNSAHRSAFQISLTIPICPSGTFSVRYKISSFVEQVINQLHLTKSKNCNIKHLHYKSKFIEVLHM